MTSRSFVIAALIVGVAVGCASRRGPLVSDGTEETGKRWTFEEAQRILEAAAVGDSPLLRASAIATLAGGATGSEWVRRGWYDPSRAVQRTIAEQHGQRLTAPDLERAGADGLARTLAVLRRGEGFTPTESLARIAARDVLLSAVFGDENSIVTLLTDVRDGMIPPEPAFVEALIRSNIPGMGAAMAEGAIQAEEEMRLPLALAAHELLPEEGQRALVDVLRDADEATKLFAVEALTERGNERATTWLRRASKGDVGAVRQHARVGLVALGLLPPDEAMNALSSPDRDLRAWAARCLGMLADNRPLPRSVIAALEATWRDESMLVRMAATQALIAASEMDAIPLSPFQAGSDLDAVSVMIAKKWFSILQPVEPADR